MDNDSRKGLAIFLRVIIVLLILAVLGVAGFIYVQIMDQKKERDQRRAAAQEIEVDKATATDSDRGKIIAEVATPTVATPTVATPVEPDREPKSWFDEVVIHKPHMTKNTISLQKADMSVFSEPASGEGSEEGKTNDPWASVTLRLNSVEGSINLHTPDEPSRSQELMSTYMILVDLDTDEIIAERDCEKPVSPASMTKILTVLTARDFISKDKLDDKFEITSDIIEYADATDCSCVGFRPGDKVTVRDLLYGTILRSGADAAIGLARYCCGDEQKFVDLMNEKAKKMGLAETTHFTNVVGLYDDELRCSMKDMAVILATAVQDDLLRDALSRRVYTTDTKYVFDENGYIVDDEDKKDDEKGTEGDAEEVEPTGIEIVNLFLYRIDDREFDGKVVAAKTGYVSQAGCCCASYYEANDGKKYVCVTGNSISTWKSIFDHASVYRSYTP
ncbi:MAG: D-alanyl-D-alanine carboxypeptidase [Eubacterium sp.]|nr:D-alanyl-D-alanine carboxypeptidase [Eubacterium sp.]